LLIESVPNLQTCRQAHEESRLGHLRFYSPAEAPPWGSEKFVRVAADYLSSQTYVLRAICDHGDWGVRAQDLTLSLLAFVSTPCALALLGRQDRLFNETIMLARPLFERVVNLCYSVVCDEPDFAKIREYTIQRAREQLSREFRAGDQVVRSCFGAKPDSTAKQNTPKKHHDSHQQWNKKIPDRLDIIQHRSDATIAIFLAYQTAFYTDSCEALHGSFYGITCHLGIYEPHDQELDRRNVQVYANETRALLLWMSGELLNELIKVVNTEKLCSDLAEIARDNSRACSDLVSRVLHSPHPTSPIGREAEWVISPHRPVA